MSWFGAARPLVCRVPPGVVMDLPPQPGYALAWASDLASQLIARVARKETSARRSPESGDQARAGHPSRRPLAVDSSKPRLRERAQRG